MSPAPPLGIAFNKTRQTFLATQLRVANTHWSRLRGLIGVPRERFVHGQALCIMPCHGVHTCFMRFPVDVIYLDRNNTVVHIEEGLRPWRFGPIRMDAACVVEFPPHTIFNSGTRIGDTFELRLSAAPAKDNCCAADPQAIA